MLIFHSYVSFPEGMTWGEIGETRDPGLLDYSGFKVQKSELSWLDVFRDFFVPPIDQPLSALLLFLRLPSGKRLHNYGKSPFLMGKLNINSHFQ